MESLTTILAYWKRWLEFAYDPQDRHIAKKVFHWNPKAASKTNSNTQTTASAWELAPETYFLHDDWNLIAEFSKISAQIKIQLAKKTYLWGLDISSSL